MTLPAFDPWSPHASVLREKVFEHLFLGDLTRALLKAGRRCEVLRAEYDGAGYDLVLEADGILRHAQLKAMRADGKRAHVDINVELAAKPSGCVIWMLVDPETFTTTRYRWFGGAPGEPLPPLGDRAVRHTKADSQGLKAERPGLRQLARSRFDAVGTTDALLNRLFGDERARDIHRLRAHLALQPALPPSSPDWLRLVRLGQFDALPAQLSDDEMVELTHLVDGYALAGLTNPETIQSAIAAPRPDLEAAHLLASDLWAAMFIEHRRLRFAGIRPDADQSVWFSEAYRHLRSALHPPRPSLQPPLQRPSSPPEPE
jgi:hypothetical protein